MYSLRLMVCFSLAFVLCPLSNAQTFKKEPVDSVSKAQRAEAISSLKIAIENTFKDKWSDEDKSKIIAAVKKYPHAFTGVLFDDWHGTSQRVEEMGRLTNGAEKWEIGGNDKGDAWEVHPGRPFGYPELGGIKKETRGIGSGPVVKWEVKKVLNAKTAVLYREVQRGPKQPPEPIYRNKQGRILNTPQDDKKKYICIDIKTDKLKANEAPDLKPFKDDLFYITGTKYIDGNETVRVVQFVLTDEEKRQLLPRFARK